MGWRHFETFHVLMTPRYASKYPPGQSLSLALGRLATGEAIWGCWFVMAAFVAAASWAFAGWLPPRWAACASLLCFVRFAGFNGWSQSYWGGGLAALGGALVLGALPRLRSPDRRWPALALALGLALMALSRPLEGLLLALPVAVVLLSRCRRSPRPKAWLLGLFCPVLAVQGLMLAFLALHNRSVTGDAFTFPFMLHQREQVAYPLFVFQERPGPKAWTNWVFALDYHFHMARYLPEETTALLAEKLRESRHLANFFLGAPLLLPALLAPFLLSGRTRRVLLAAALLVGGAVALQVEAAPRKLAPIAMLPILFACLGLRLVTLWRRRQGRMGRRIATAAVLAPLAAWPFLLHGAFLNPMGFPWGQWRENLKQRLLAQEGRDLVFCHYRPERHSHRFEWVYNRASIAEAEIIWAHDLGEKANAALARSYPGRRLWWLDADGDGSCKAYRPGQGPLTSPGGRPGRP